MPAELAGLMPVQEVELRANAPCEYRVACDPYAPYPAFELQRALGRGLVRAPARALARALARARAQALALARALVRVVGALARELVVPWD